MGNSKLKVPPEFKSAPKEQQIDFVHELWDQIAQDPGSVPIPESHKKILRERLEAFRANPQPGKPWSEVRDQLLAKIGKA
jgi:putative addiction module component (TIGR02574 family)